MIDLIGLIGVIGGITIAIPYLMILIGKWKASDYKFLGTNIVGNICLLSYALMTPEMLFVYPLLNMILLIGTIIQTVKEYRRRKK